MFNAPTSSILEQTLPGWKVGRVLGQGSYKVAYEAERNGTVEALKLFWVPPFGPSDEAQLAQEKHLGRFIRELRLLGSCKSPALVKLGSMEPEVINVEGNTYVAYSEQMISGETLQDLMKSGYLASEDEIRSLLRCLIGSISELWGDHRCVHRDIKPGNIIKTQGAPAQFVLLDLGMTFEVRGTRFTDPGFFPGTPLYKAPEMLDPDYAGKLDARTDLYCAGVTAFEFACGEHPLGRDDGKQSIESKILRQLPRRLEEIRAGFSEQTYELINRLNRKKPALRGNIQLLLQELDI